METDRKTTADLNPLQEGSNTHDSAGKQQTGGEMGDRIRTFDWSKTPLGSIESWSPALLTTVRIMLANRFPLLLWWGPQYTSIYNDEYSSRFGIRVHFDEPDTPMPRLSQSIQITLLRIAQEALFNVAKHARAHEVDLSLLWDSSSVYLKVEDHGVGMEHQQPDTRSDSHGLTIMRERADAVGGEVNVTSQPGVGTKIEVNIPIPSDPQSTI